MTGTLTIIYFAVLTSSLIYLLARADTHVSAIADTVSGSGAEPSPVRRKWITEMMADAEMSFDMRRVPDVSDQCRRDFDTYKLHVRNQTIWAVRMMESSEWPRTGLVSGVTTHLGHYAECLRSRGPNGIEGQYCLAEATYRLNDGELDQTTPGLTEWPEETASTWKTFDTYDKNPFRKSRRSLVWAICVPSSCSAADLQKSLDNALHPVFEAQNGDVAARVQPEFCITEKTSRFADHFNVGWCVIMILKVILISATTYDFIFGTYQGSKDNRTGIKLVKCFSARQNYKLLFQSSTNDTYTFLYFIQIFLISTIIWGHATAIFYMFPKYETEEQEMAYNPWSLVLLTPNFVNAFIMMSGFLTAARFNFSPNVDGSVSFFIRSLTMKWLRMAPVNGLAILGFFYIVPFIENAPLLNHVLRKELEFCSSNWWINILTMQNMINPGEMCQPNTWCIAADIQLFAICTALLIIYRKNQKRGIYAIVFTVLCCTAYSFLKLYSSASYKLYTEFFTMNILDYRKSVSTILPIHTMPYYRAGPYFTGCVTAFLVKMLMDKGYKFSCTQSIVMIFSSFVIGFGGQLYGLTFYTPGRQNHPLQIAVFGILQPIFNVLPFVSLICIHFVSGFGRILNSVFELKLFVPLGKLSYSIYMVSLGVQSYHILSQRRPISSFSQIDQLWWIMGDVFFVLVTALVFYFVCEAPAINVINLFLRPHLIRKKSEPMTESPAKEDTNSRGIIRNGNGLPLNGVSQSVRMRMSKTTDGSRQTYDAKSSLD